jgi:hypothetical protein
MYSTYGCYLDVMKYLGHLNYDAANLPISDAALTSSVLMPGFCSIRQWKPCVNCIKRLKLFLIIKHQAYVHYTIPLQSMLPFCACPHFCVSWMLHSHTFYYHLSLWNYLYLTQQKSYAAEMLVTLNYNIR